MIVAVIGKGGVGKTTITSLLLRRLLESGQTPVLAIDADPSNCLGSSLGIAIDRTLADMRETMRDRSGRPPSMSSAEWLALRAEEAIVENTGFDLLTMGRPEGKSCYCFVNNLIREHLDRLSRSYRHVLVDCEAGLEHLSRRTSGRPDALICVANRSRMAAETIRRCLSLYQSIHGALPPRVDLMLNQFEAGEPLAAEMTAIAAGGLAPFSLVFAIPGDPQVAGFESAGKSLLDLSLTTPALAALGAWEIHP
ncbi:MAG: AAA family ATPase [Acidobacteria bacterium]|nr:AAA family ATPase [Acidobacteriota bacterium]